MSFHVRIFSAQMSKLHDNQIIYNRRTLEESWFIKKFHMSAAFYLAIMGVFFLGLFGRYVKLSFENYENRRNELIQNRCKIPELTSPDQFFEELERTTNTCKNLITIGGKPWGNTDVIDGDKKVCMDPELDFKRGNCTVLSFGILTDWSFDDEMDKTYKCKVYAFDPTIGYKNHDRSTRLKFFNLGLGKTDGYKQLGGKMAKIQKYGTIINQLGLQGSEIDYLKMDVEGSEVHFFDQVFHPSSSLLSNVKQIGMEIHPGHVDFDLYYLKFWETLHKLKCSGFQISYSSPNLVTSNHYILDGKVRSTCYEILWVNTRRQDLSNNGLS